jgi:hypothetical protein
MAHWLRLQVANIASFIVFDIDKQYQQKQSIPEPNKPEPKRSPSFRRKGGSPDLSSGASDWGRESVLLPLPPNGTSGSPAYGFPVGGLAWRNSSASFRASMLSLPVFRKAVPPWIAHHYFRDVRLYKERGIRTLKELSRSYLIISKDHTRVMNRDLQTQLLPFSAGQRDDGIVVARSEDSVASAEGGIVS